MQIVRKIPSQKKTHHKKGLVEWVKVQALSSNPSTAKKKKSFSSPIYHYLLILKIRNIKI
jgi:hypothetical protein